MAACLSGTATQVCSRPDAHALSPPWGLWCAEHHIMLGALVMSEKLQVWGEQLCAVELQTDCMVAVLACMIEAPRPHVFALPVALGYNLPPL